MQSNIRAVVVDSDSAICDGFAALLGTYGIDVEVYSSAESLFETFPLSGRPVGCLLVETNLPGLNGFSLIRQLREQGFSAAIIVLTNSMDQYVEQQAACLDAVEVLEKPLINGLLMERLVGLLPKLARLPNVCPTNFEPNGNL